MNLIIDVGNTQVKAAVFEKENIQEDYVFQHEDFTELISEVKNRYPIKACILSTVKEVHKDFLLLLETFPYFLQLDSTTDIPFKNRYATQNTLGIDRIALVAAASCKFSNTNVLIIDAGTCITYDFLNDQNEYLGGAISPGITIRYRSLHDYTAKLPLLNAQEEFQLIGDSTSASIHSGVFNGVIQEIDGVIDQYREKYKVLTVVLTGGDTKRLSKQLKNSIFATQNFLLYGLNKILTFNNQE